MHFRVQSRIVFSITAVFSQEKIVQLDLGMKQILEYKRRHKVESVKGVVLQSIVTILKC